MRKPVTTLAAAALLALAVALPARAESWAVDEDHSTVSFQVRHLLTKVRGQFDAFRGTVEMDPQHPERGSVDLVIDAASIDTDLDKRDEHLRSADFFDTARFPQVTFRSSQVRVLSPGHLAVAGTLTMHGVSHEVTLPVELLGVTKDPWGGTRAGFAVALTLDRKDYGVTWNKALDAGGAVLGDEVEIDIQIEALQQAPAAAR